MTRRGERGGGDDARTGRRRYLKAVGAAALAGALPDRAAADDGENEDEFTVTEREAYTEVTVHEDGSWIRNVGDGERLENYLIDVTAPGANAQIVPTGADWAVRNVGFWGKIGDGGTDKRIAPSVDAGATGAIDRVYLGDGATGDWQGGIWVQHDHAGELLVRRCNVQEWSDNGVYASGPGKPNGGGGTVHIADCYAKNNNTASYRIGTRGSTIRDSVVHIDAPVPSKRGRTDGRAVWAWCDRSTDAAGGDRYAMENLNIAVDHEGGTWAVDTYPNSFQETTVDLVDSHWRGGDGLALGVTATNVGHEPDLTPPAGVPLTAHAAARGLD